MVSIIAMLTWHGLPYAKRSTAKKTHNVDQFVPDASDNDSYEN